MSDQNTTNKATQRETRAKEKAAAELALEVENDVREERKSARTNKRLYGFDPDKVGGYTRVPNVYWDNLSEFKAYNIKTGELRKDKTGNYLHASKFEDADGKFRYRADPLEPLDHLVLMTIMMWYQRKANAMSIQFSVRDLAKKIGKSERQVHRAVKKLRDLNYIRQVGRVGVRGGHVANYDITLFLQYLRYIADNVRLREAQKEKEAFSDFGSDAHQFEDVLKDFEVVPIER